jgi:thiamine-phosphate pyrophosphorylase
MIVHAIVDSFHEVRADVVHVRNKEIEARELWAIARAYAAQGLRVIVNTRCDVALAAGASGLHLPAGSIAPSRWRAIVPQGFSIGVSCHTRVDLERAQAEGADYAYLSPVFAPLSKPDPRPPLGWDGFSRTIEGLTIPVLALGGMTLDRRDAAARAGAAGIAGITLGLTQQ